MTEPDMRTLGVTSQPEDEDPLNHIGEPLPEDELHDWLPSGVCADCGAVREDT